MTKERINDFKKIVLPSISKLLFDVNYEGQGKCDAEEFAKDFNEILDLTSKALEQKPKTGDWIPVSERLPENLEPVNITWVNRNPESYYADIKDKPFTATGHYCEGKWYWYSSTCQDYLEEYGRCDVDEIDKDIEVLAWMPLPEPYKAESEEE